MHACRMHLPMLAVVVRGALNMSPQLVLVSMAPYILLTRSAALGFMAHIIAHEGLVHHHDMVLDPHGRLKGYLMTEGVRFLGMPTGMALACKDDIYMSLTSRLQAPTYRGFSCSCSGKPVQNFSNWIHNIEHC